MNKERRKNILDALQILGGARAMIETARDEEQEYFDAMPEGLQNGAKGELAQSAISALEEAIEAIESAESALDMGE